MTYRKSYCIPIYTKIDTGSDNVSATHDTPRKEKIAICFPTNIKDTDVIHIRTGWSHSEGRGIKIWLTNTAVASPDFADGALNASTTGLLVHVEATSTSTNYANFPVSETSVAVGSVMGAHIRGNGGVNLYTGQSASDATGVLGACAGVNIWLEGNDRL